MPSFPHGIAPLLATLTAGAARHAIRDAAARGRLAEECAAGVARVADAWVDAAVAIKHGTSAAVAEETATGPLGTLRLLLITARALRDIAREGLPGMDRPPRLIHPRAGGSACIAVDLLPVARLHDAVIFPRHSATVRCVDPGGAAAFVRGWRREADERPRSGGVACVLGAGNVTGLAAADALSQIFEYGRAVLLKLHPLHAPLEPVLLEALAPLVEAGLLAVIAGGQEIAREVVASPLVTHVHLTGGQAAFDAIVWGGRDPRAAGATPLLDKPITCELGNVTPWIIAPGRYTSAELASQADLVAASIANNTSFNCIATKIVITCRGWPQREEFLARVGRRLQSLPARPAWYPGAGGAWEAITGRRPPDDGSLPWVFRTALDPCRDPEWLAREWFVPVAAETALDADDMESFCGRAGAFCRGLPGSLAASVTIPALPVSDRDRVELLVEHLEYGVVAVNTWSALAYSLASVPWGGYPGSTLSSPRSGIGRVHDPLLLPLVHNTILRAPLAMWPVPPWLPWHPAAGRLARGLAATYAAIGRGGRGLGSLARMLPDVIRSALRPPPLP